MQNLAFNLHFLCRILKGRVKYFLNYCNNLKLILKQEFSIYVSFSVQIIPNSFAKGIVYPDTLKTQTLLLLLQSKGNQSMELHKRFSQGNPNREQAPSTSSASGFLSLMAGAFLLNIKISRTWDHLAQERRHCYLLLPDRIIVGAMLCSLTSEEQETETQGIQDLPKTSVFVNSTDWKQAQVSVCFMIFLNIYIYISLRLLR